MVVVQLAFGAYLVAINYRVECQSWTQRNAVTSKSALYGIWNIDGQQFNWIQERPFNR